MTRRGGFLRSFPWAVILCALLPLTACGPPLPDDEANWVLQDLAAGDASSPLKNHYCPPSRNTVSYQLEKRLYLADLYLPGQSPRAAMVLSPGLAEAGKNDARLRGFATTLARAGFLVLVPDLPNLRALKVRHEDVRGLSDAFVHLQSLPQLDEQTPLGIGAFSYTAGPAVLAAMQKTIRNEVDYVLTVGGYFDLEQVVQFSTTGYFRKQGEWLYLEPNEYGKWVFVLSNADLLSRPSDQQALRQIAEQKLQEPGKPVGDVRADLDAEAQSVLALVQNGDRARTQALIQALPADIRSQLDLLNLAKRDLSRLKAKLLLVHGTDDNIIPYTESLELHQTLPPDQSELFLIDGLAHVDLRPLALDRYAA